MSPSQGFPRALFQQACGELLAEHDRIRTVLMIEGGADHSMAVGGCDGSSNCEASRRWLAVNADRNLAASTKGGERGALRGDRKASGLVVKKVESVDSGAVSGAGFDGEGTLSSSGTENERGKPFAEIFRAAETL